jgi:peptide subunit release factor 1 (eRF1)
MITLAIPPKDQISRVNKMLTEEYEMCFIYIMMFVFSLLPSCTIFHMKKTKKNNQNIKISKYQNHNKRSGTASRIKSHENKLSVLSAITSTQQRLKNYKNVPENGLIIFCGYASSEDGRLLLFF